MQCIESHEGTVKPQTLEAQLVHDADIIDKSGILGIIRHTWKILNTSKKSNSIDETISQVLFHNAQRQSSVCSKTGQRIVHLLETLLADMLSDKKQFRTIMSIVIDKILHGNISDQIATTLSKKFPSSIGKLAIIQLNCSFLSMLLSIQKRVQCFECIRDLPYCLADSKTDTSCITKSRLLSDLFNRISIQNNIIQAPFNWNDIPFFNLLAKVRQNIGKSLISNHFLLHVFVPERKKWVFVDPTWDLSLHKVLPVAHWDGITDTTFAVPINAKNIQVIRLSDLPLINTDLSSSFVQHLNDLLHKFRHTNYI